MYDYQFEKPNLLRPENMALILKAKSLIDEASKKTGAITYECAFRFCCGFGTSWQMMACLDYLVEQGFYTRVPGASRAGQHQILVSR